MLGDQLFRIEHNSEKAFRDEATQTVWYRNMPEQSYDIEENNSFLLVKTKSCELKILEKRADCRIRLNGGDWKRISNDGNLKGTYRTLDCCDGNSHQKTSSIFDYTERPYPIHTTMHNMTDVFGLTVCGRKSGTKKRAAEIH